MKAEEKLELLRLLEARTLSDWGRRKRRLERIPIHVVADAIEKGAKRAASDHRTVHCFPFRFLAGRDSEGS